jgi:hypothetical protein
MFCSKCGNRNGEGERFCRKCGKVLEHTAVKQDPLRQQSAIENLTDVRSKDPDELTGNGIGSVIIGDGFFMVAVILSASQSSVSSLLWLFLLIPAFFFFGKGFADVFHARQIRRRLKQTELKGAAIGELSPGRDSVVEVLRKSISGELVSVTDRTTRNLS